MKTCNSMKGTIMSRMLMALGVVAALSLFPTEVTAAPFPVLPPAAASSEIVVPGYSCIDVAYAAANVQYANNSIIGLAALPGSSIICPLPRPVSSSSNVTVSVAGTFTFATQCFVLALNTVPNFQGITGTAPVIVPVSPDASLSLQCTGFGLGDVIKSIKVKI